MEWTGMWRLVLFDVVNWFPGCLKDMMRVGIKKKKRQSLVVVCMCLVSMNIKIKERCCI